MNGNEIWTMCFKVNIQPIIDYCILNDFEKGQNVKSVQVSMHQQIHLNIGVYSAPTYILNTFCLFCNDKY